MLTSTIKKTKIFRIVQALSRQERFVLTSALVISLVSGVAYGLLLLDAKTYAVAAEGGEYTEGVIGQPVFINPVIPTTEVDRDIARIVFSSVAEVADSIKRSDDGTVWNVRLKENIFWQDGERLTADDIIFTLEVIQDPDSRSPLHASFQGVAAERVSELEVQFVLQNTYVFFESDHLANLRIIPKHIFNDIPVQNMKLSSFGLRPVGSGPYQVESLVKNGDGIIVSLKLISNKDYFAGRPNIKTITFNFYRNIEDMARAYNFGQIDAFGIETAEPLNEYPINIRNAIHFLESPRYYAVFINQSLAPEEFQELEVREAVAATVNRNRIIDDVFLGNAIPFFGPTGITENPIGEYDPALLEGLEINLTVPEEPFLIKTANLLKEDWEAQGATVNVLIFSLKNIQESILKNSDYEFILFGNITKESQDLFAFWHSSRRFYPDQNLALYQDETVDSLLEEFRKTFNTEDRFGTLTRISNIVAADVPAVFLYSPRYVYVTAPRLRGFNDATVMNTSDDRFEGIHKWHVRTKRSFEAPGTDNQSPTVYGEALPD